MSRPLKGFGRRLRAVLGRYQAPCPPKVAPEMALHVLAYNFTSALNIISIQQLMAAIMA
jgi:hypothetical protein